MRSVLKKLAIPSKCRKNSGNFHVMQRWSHESGNEMRLPLGALMCRVRKGQSKSVQWCSGAAVQRCSGAAVQRCNQ